MTNKLRRCVEGCGLVQDRQLPVICTTQRVGGRLPGWFWCGAVAQWAGDDVEGKRMPRKSEIGATRDSPVFQLRMPVALRKEWDAYCAKRGKAPAAQMRTLMEYLIRDDMPEALRTWLAVQTGEAGDKQHVDLRLTLSEYAAAEQRAASEGVSLRHWLETCARASLVHDTEPVFAAADQLNRSSEHLQGVGRDLNEIAKRVNAGEPVKISVEQVERLTQYIQRHMDKMDVVTAHSLSRWRLTPPPGGLLDDEKLP